MLLRIAIGWHFLYEGLWKLDTDDAGRQMLTSRYFLQSSTARLRDALAAGAPAEARIDQWQDEILKHFKGQNNELSKVQQKDLAAVAAELKLHSTAEIDWVNIHEQILKIEPKPDGHFTSLEYLQGSTGPFRPLFRMLAPDIEGLERLTTQSARARLERRYDELVRHYRFTDAQKQKLALVRDDVTRAIAATLEDPGFRTRIEDYKFMLQREREYAREARQPFARERREAYRKRLDMVGSELLAFVNEPLVELTRQAQNLATVEQMKYGPAPRPREQTWFIDFAVKWGLVGMGLALILGLFSQVAGAAAAAQLAMFYLAAPPLPGLPAATLGGHFIYVDRNLIEMLAALLIMTVPSGKWAGLDAWLVYLRDRLSSRRQEVSYEPERAATANR